MNLLEANLLESLSTLSMNLKVEQDVTGRWRDVIRKTLINKTVLLYKNIILGAQAAVVNDENIKIITSYEPRQLKVCNTGCLEL